MLTLYISASPSSSPRVESFIAPLRGTVIIYWSLPVEFYFCRCRYNETLSLKESQNLIIINIYSEIQTKQDTQ
jgi:hypothetical protein